MIVIPTPLHLMTLHPTDGAQRGRKRPKLRSKTHMNTLYSGLIQDTDADTLVLCFGLNSPLANPQDTYYIKPWEIGQQFQIQRDVFQ